jgi:hypothetical protein
MRREAHSARSVLHEARRAGPTTRALTQLGDSTCPNEPSYRRLLSPTWMAWLAAEGPDARDVLAQDQGVDLIGSFIGPHGFEVVGVPQR